MRAHVFRCAPRKRHRAMRSACPFRAISSHSSVRPAPVPLSRGRVMMNSVNTPGSVSTSILPPCCLTMMSWVIERPSPVPSPPALTLISTLYAREGADGQAVVCPLLRGSSATRGVAPNQHRGLRRSFSPAFRAGSLYPLARGCRTIWRGEKWLRRRDALRDGVSFATTRSHQLAEGCRRRRRGFRFIDFRCPR